MEVFVHPDPAIYSSSDFPYVWIQKYLTHTIYFLYEYIVRSGRSDDKGLSSLPASLYKRKFEEFSMNGGPGFNKKNSSHLCDEFPYSAIQLPSAISLGKSSRFLVLRSENIQLPEDESSGSCIQASTFGPIW